MTAPALAAALEAERQRLADVAWLAHREACVADRRDDKWTAVADAMLVECEKIRADARRQAIEECAQIAEQSTVRGLRAGYRADAWDACCRRIADAIRALLPPPGVTGGRHA